MHVSIFVIGEARIRERFEDNVSDMGIKNQKQDSGRKRHFGMVERAAD